MTNIPNERMNQCANKLVPMQPFHSKKHPILQFTNIFFTFTLIILLKQYRYI